MDNTDNTAPGLGHITKYLTTEGDIGSGEKCVTDIKCYKEIIFRRLITRNYPLHVFSCCCCHGGRLAVPWWAIEI